MIELIGELPRVVVDPIGWSNGEPAGAPPTWGWAQQQVMSGLSRQAAKARMDKQQNCKTQKDL
jgi:hypothetical protein